MFLTLLKSKIHRATVTDTNLNYVGSITIDEALMEVAEILPHEKLQVMNNNNGARFETYVIRSPRNSGVICLNGAAARLAQPGDTVIILSYVMLEAQEARTFQPMVVQVDSANRITEVRRGEVHGEIV